MSADGEATDLRKVAPVVEMIDLVADDIDADPEGVAEAALSKVRRRHE
jgi:hypothetical protein